MCTQGWINQEWGALLHLFYRVQNRPNFTATSTEEFFTGTIIHQKITLSSIYSMKVPLRNLSLHLGFLMQPYYSQTNPMYVVWNRAAEKRLTTKFKTWAEGRQMRTSWPTTKKPRKLFRPCSGLQTSSSKRSSENRWPVTHPLLLKVKDRPPESQQLLFPAPQFLHCLILIDKNCFCQIKPGIWSSSFYFPMYSDDSSPPQQPF